MKRTLLGTSIAVTAAGILGAVGLNCSDTVLPYVPDGGGGGSGSASTGSSSGSASGMSSGSAMAGTFSGTGSGSALSGSFSGSGSGNVASGSSSGSGSGNVASGSSSGGSGGSGNASGSSGASSGSGGGTVEGIFGIANKFGEKFSDSFILFPCYSNQAQDCITIPQGTACPHMNDMTLPYEQRGVQFDEYFQLGGTVGQMYTATIHVEGISEAKYYMGGKCDPAMAADQPKCQMGRADGLLDPPNANTLTINNASDTFYTAGAPVDFEFYNVYKLVVHNPAPAGAMVDPGSGVSGAGTEVQHYYLNSFPKTNTPYETHSTYFINYTHKIAVPGGGVIQYHMGDTNCHAIDNCGSGVFTVTCAANAGRSIPNLTIPATSLGRQTSVINPRTGTTQPFHSHVLHVTVTAVQ